MICNTYTLFQNKQCSVFYCHHCGNKISVLYGNIAVSFDEECFLLFKESINAPDIDEYFITHPCEDKIHIRSELNTIFFSFSYKEILELRKILTESYLRLQINKMLYLGNQNN
jgi:hypothetical protein